MNQGYVSGICGALKRADNRVLLRLCQKDSYFNKKTNQWETDENWHSIMFFGNKADALEEKAQVGDRLIVTYSLHTHPKDGPMSRTRLNGTSFYVIIPFNLERSPRPIDPLKDMLEQEEDIP